MTTVARTISLAKNAEESIPRFDVHQIIQHAGLMVSFIVLVATGLPLKFAESAASKWWVAVWGGIEATRSAHHLFAWVMVIVCLYHLVYILHTTLILKHPSDKNAASSQDALTYYQEIKYFLD